MVKANIGIERYVFIHIWKIGYGKSQKASYGGKLSFYIYLIDEWVCFDMLYYCRNTLVCDECATKRSRATKVFWRVFLF